ALGEPTAGAAVHLLITVPTARADAAAAQAARAVVAARTFGLGSFAFALAFVVIARAVVMLAVLAPFVSSVVTRLGLARRAGTAALRQEEQRSHGQAAYKKGRASDPDRLKTHSCLGIRPPALWVQGL